MHDASAASNVMLTSIYIDLPYIITDSELVQQEVIS
jgi:hypothetical protein